MIEVKLPISKSIANRILLLQAIHRDPLMRVSAIGVPTRTTQQGENDMPDDVRVLHDALARLREYKKGEPLALDLKNCGTAFWYEHVALHGGELLLEGLTDESLQGDRIVADIYAAYFGVQTTFTADSASFSH